MRTKKIYVADFETTTKPPVQVWLWGMVSIDFDNPINYLTGDNYVYGTDIASFIDYCKSLKNATVFIHNLKFEDSYIFDYLLNNGFEFIDPDERPEECKNKFTCIIGGDNSVHYMTKIIFSKDKKHNINKVTFVNSANIIKASVLEMAVDLKNQYYIDIKTKAIDYDRHNDINADITHEELTYNKVDCMIVAETLQIMQSMGLELNDRNITIGSNALNLYKKMLCEKKKSKIIFDKLFIDRYDRELDDKFRRAYRGGLNYMNVKSGEIINNVIVIDKNSMYSYIMANMLLPYGKPYRFDGEFKGDKDKLYIQYVKIWGRCKENRIPFIKNKSDDRIESIDYERNIYLHTWITSIELDYLKENYDIVKIEYYEGYYFAASTYLFNSYFISQFYNAKEQSRGKNYTIFRVSKLLLENLYGKFGTKYKQTSMQPTLMNGKVNYKLITREENGVTKNYREKHFIYTPLAAFVTAHAKIELLKTADKIIDQFGIDSILYCDTDSIHFKMPDTGELPEGIEISTKMGAWKIENIAYKAKYLGCKRYVLADKDNNIIKCVCAGLDKKAQNQVTWDNFKPGTIYHNCKQSIIEKGGMIIKNNGIFELT